MDGLLDWGGLTPVDTTGPVFLSRIWEEHPRLFKDVVVYPSVRKMRLDCFVPCSDARDLFFAKTGSGQTWEKLRQKALSAERVLPCGG